MPITTGSSTINDNIATVLPNGNTISCCVPEKTFSA